MLYAAKPLSYEPIPNVPENADRIRSLPGTYDPLMMNSENIIVWCVETESVVRVCADQAEFDIRYQPIE